MRSLLLKSPPFSVLRATELSQLAQRARELEFKKGQAIFKEGQPSSFVWVIKEGWVRLIKESLVDKAVTIDILTPKEALCGISVIDKQPYSASAIAVTDCVVAKIPSADVLALIKSNPEFAQELLTICCHRIRHVAESCVMLNEPVPYRIAKTLVHLEVIFGKSLPVTHKEIAGITGTRVETVIRFIGKMKRKGWVQVFREKIELLHPEKIRAYSTNGGTNELPVDM